MFAAFFWKRASHAGAVACIIAGVVVTLLWKEASFVKHIIPQNFYDQTDEVLPAIFISVLCLVVFSLALPDKRK
jgi:Na+/proline symporter